MTSKNKAREKKDWKKVRANDVKINGCRTFEDAFHHMLVGKQWWGRYRSLRRRQYVRCPCPEKQSDLWLSIIYIKVKQELVIKNIKLSKLFSRICCKWFCENSGRLTTLFLTVFYSLTNSSNNLSPFHVFRFDFKCLKTIKYHPMFFFSTFS